ncbi:hypothetical protein DB31_0689 [Hyalangium minutum]|uniref:Uncharacterized protein n=1 Tax=Hyalangium minutum TaxID=394096 RepID=A0A085WXL3_9BACT|nr:hypothetical protein DB31_0689 [Hyalangium minutum]
MGEDAVALALKSKDAARLGALTALLEGCGLYLGPQGAQPLAVLRWKSLSGVDGRLHRSQRPQIGGIPPCTTEMAGCVEGNQPSRSTRGRPSP